MKIVDAIIIKLSLKMHFSNSNKIVFFLLNFFFFFNLPFYLYAANESGAHLEDNNKNKNQQTDKEKKSKN